MLALYVKAIGCGTREGAGLTPTQKSNSSIHTRCIAGFLQRPLLKADVQFGPYFGTKPDNTTILWPFGLLSGSEDNFGNACFHGLIQRNSFISGVVSACYNVPLGGDCVKYNAFFKTIGYKAEKDVNKDRARQWLKKLRFS